MRIAPKVIICASFLLASAGLCKGEVSVQGAPVSPGYNVGTAAIIRATLKGAAAAAAYTVLGEVRYASSSSVQTIELHGPTAASSKIAQSYEGQWSIPGDASTGLYTLELRVEDRSTHAMVASAKAPGFFVFRKQIQITHVTLDKTFYAPGERIRCEVGIDNLTSKPLEGLVVEFSNENYPWISTFSGAANASGRMEVNPSLGLVVLRPSLEIPAHGHATLPMEPAGAAQFLQGSQVAVMGAGGPARHEAVASPEVDRYTVAVWDEGRRNLLDMQFSPQVIVRDPGRVLPKPYSRNYTHPYNDEIDFSKYREFYPPGYISPSISIDRSHTLFRPGDTVKLSFTATNTSAEQEPRLTASVTDSSGHTTSESNLDVPNWEPGSTIRLTRDVWTVPADAAPGTYKVTLDVASKHAVSARAAVEVAVNKLPPSLMVFCPHEDDEHPWAGMIRAMIEDGLPVHVVFFTGGDVGECERYFDGHPCDPSRAREFGTVRMEESTEALEHLGVKRDQISFLGLPDGGSGEIWFHHIAPANPFLSIYLAVDHAPYEGMFEPDLPYARDSVIDAVERLITNFHPALIATPHPDERHVDHRTANWFALKACQELVKSGRLDPATTVLADRAYGSGGYTPAPYHYEPYTVYLSGEVAALKQAMGWVYQSQDGNLDEGSKQTFSELPREELHYRIVDWPQHEGWNEH
jgi:LmbE family N-acetylglucosaminyl deacetylase